MSHICEPAAPGTIDSSGPVVDSAPVMPVRSESFEHRAPETSVSFTVPALPGLWIERSVLLIPRPKLPSIKNGISLSDRDAGIIRPSESGVMCPMKPSPRAKLLTLMWRRTPSFRSLIRIGSSKAESSLRDVMSRTKAIYLGDLL